MAVFHSDIDSGSETFKANAELMQAGVDEFRQVEQGGVDREAMQILGGIGYMRGNRVERIYREVRVNAIGGGSEEIMRDLASRQYGL